MSAMSARRFPRLALLMVALLATIAGVARAAQPAELDDEACAAFGHTIAGHFDAGNAKEVVDLLDQFGFLDRITVGLGYNANEERDFRAGVLKTLPQNLTTQFETFTSGRFLRVQKVGAEKRALVRVVSEDGAANYLAFTCSRRGNGPLRWSDAFVYMSGETMSESSRRTILPLVAQSKKGLIERLTKNESEFVAHFPKVHQASRFIQSGEMAKAWAEVEKLPASLKKDRTVLMLRLRAAQAVGEPEYLKVIEDWEAAFPGDATLDFISIDGDVMRKDYTKAVQHIDSFAKRIGGDAYLDFLAANVLLMAERYEESEKRARAGLKTEPKLANAYDVLLTIALKAKNHAEIISILETLRGLYPTMNIEEVVADDLYKDFRASDAYRAWLAKQPAAKK